MGAFTQLCGKAIPGEVAQFLAALVDLSGADGPPGLPPAISQVRRRSSSGGAALRCRRGRPLPCPG
jgi:hypothetical protein